MESLITPGNRANLSKSPEVKTTPGAEKVITPDIKGKSPTLIITLAISLPKERVRKLTDWLRQNVNPRISLEIRKDPQIIGGCRLVFRGREADFSLRKELQKELKERGFNASQSV